jgi:hypothetical protein
MELLRVRRARVLLAAAASVCAVLAAPAPASAESYDTVFRTSFESNLAGWKGQRSTLARALGGAAGRHSALVRRRMSGSRFAIYRSRRPIAVPGATYVAGAWARVPVPDRLVCLRVGELRFGRLVSETTRCARSTGRWQALPDVSHLARARNRLTVFVFTGLGGRRSFRVDSVKLRRTLLSAPRPAPAGRWYSADSPFNEPIAPGAAADPASPAMVGGLVDAAGYTGFAINVRRWTVPVYYADSSTPRTNVALTESWSPYSTLSGVPIPAGAAPDPSDDASMAIIDGETGCEYDFYAARKRADGSWAAGWANTTYVSWNGVDPGGVSARGSGFWLGAGLIRPEELAAGSIDHALVMSYRYTKAGGPVAPATHSDGRSTSSSAIPTGGRLQLDPALDLDALGLAPWQTTIARALQTYGAFVADTSTGIALYAQNPQGLGAGAYPWGEGDYASLPASLVSRLRVLRLGPQTTPKYYVTPTACATFR